MPMRRPTAQITRIGPREIFERMGVDMFRQAYEQGLSLSGHLERLNPTDPSDQSGLDAFGRVCQEQGIVVRSVPEAGVYSDTWDEAFDQGDVRRRALGVEWLHRKYREADSGGFGSASTRQVFTSSDAVLNSWLRPYYDNTIARVQALQPQIPLSEMIAVTTPIDSNAYRAAYVVDTANANKRFVRVGETAEVPRILLVTSERTVTLYKYGRAMESSYEALRRQRLDRVALLVQLMSIQAQVDKVATALDVLINGDGNGATAATNHNLTTLDPAATAGTLTLKGWLGYKLKFLNPYMLTTIVANDAVVLQTQLLSTGTANIPLVAIAGASGFGGFRPINPQLGDTVRYGVSADAPSRSWALMPARHWSA